MSAQLDAILEAVGAAPCLPGARCRGRHALLMTDEYWLPVPGWDGWYSIQFARPRPHEHRKIVRSDNVASFISEKPRKVITWPNGRKTVRLRRDGQQFTMSGSTGSWPSCSAPRLQQTMATLQQTMEMS